MDKKVTIDSPEFMELLIDYRSVAVFNKSKIVAHIDERLNELVYALETVIDGADAIGKKNELFGFLSHEDATKVYKIFRKYRGE